MDLKYTDTFGTLYETYIGARNEDDGIDRYNICIRIGQVSRVLMKDVPDFALEEEMKRCRDIIEAFYKVMKEAKRYERKNGRR